MSDTLPLSIQNNRRIEKWLRFGADRTVRLAVGKRLIRWVRLFQDGSFGQVLIDARTYVRSIAR